VAALTAAAFGQSGEVELVAALRQSGDAVISLVAEDAAGVCGHVLFSKMRAKDLRALALAPLATAPGRERRGVGSALVHAGLDLAKAAGFDAVFVLGDPGFYSRFGFTAEAAAPFASPYAGPRFLGLGLTKAADASGPLEHPEAFSALGG
jgi:putative acetyltransferase